MLFKYILRPEGEHELALLKREILPKMMIRLVSMIKESRSLKEVWSFPNKSEDILNKVDHRLLIYQLSNDKCSGISGS